MFTYAGFRYVSLTGFPGTPDFNTLTAHFVHTDYELTGSVSFSDPLLTAVQHITRTAAMSNFQSIPTGAGILIHASLGRENLAGEKNTCLPTEPVQVCLTFSPKTECLQ